MDSLLGIPFLLCDIWITIMMIEAEGNVMTSLMIGAAAFYATSFWIFYKCFGFMFLKKKKELFSEGELGIFFLMHISTFVIMFFVNQLAIIRHLKILLVIILVSIIIAMAKNLIGEKR